MVYKQKRTFLEWCIKKIRKIFNLDGKKGKTRINLVSSFPLYKPYSAGTYKDRSALTLLAINELIPVLSSFTKSLGYKSTETIHLNSLLEPEQSKSANELKAIFDKHHSDKGAEYNSYHLLYSMILADRSAIKNVFEIGLGTNNTDVVSNMGKEGSPGASLRAFREFLPHAEIFGADVDKRVLFEDERIRTFHVDQTDDKTFDLLNQQLPNHFDLMIDDGLHAPNANVRALNFFLSHIKVGGWAVIEDIGEPAIPVWELIGSILPAEFESAIYRTEKAILFAVKRVN